MNTIIVLYETFTNGYLVIMLDLISLAAILSGILVIISKNPVVSVLFLIGLFLSISSYLLVLGINFIGLAYLLVYVGAVSILFLFILMLINVRISELLSNTSNSIPLAIAITIAFSYPSYQVLPYSIAAFNNYIINSSNIFNTLSSSNYSNFINKWINIFIANITEGKLYYATSVSWDGNLAPATHITSIGNLMYSNNAIWLLVTSLILLLAMTGVIVIVIKTRTSSNSISS